MGKSSEKESYSQRWETACNHNDGNVWREKPSSNNGLGNAPAADKSGLGFLIAASVAWGYHLPAPGER